MFSFYERTEDLMSEYAIRGRENRRVLREDFRRSTFDVADDRDARISALLHHFIERKDGRFTNDAAKRRDQARGGRDGFRDVSGADSLVGRRVDDRDDGELYCWGTRCVDFTRTNDSENSRVRDRRDSGEVGRKGRGVRTPVARHQQNIKN